MSENKQKEDEKPIVAKTAVDLQRLKLMKLMKNPEKPIILPERPKPKNTPTVPEFVRNVMGSSAGAGSGEFHVYRHLRRKEYARQKFIQEKGKKEMLDDEYHKKLEENKKLASELTAKKRAKRLKKKQKWKQKKKVKPADGNKGEGNHSSTDEPSDDEEPDDNNTTNKSENDKSNSANSQVFNQEDNEDLEYRDRNNADSDKTESNEIENKTKNSDIHELQQEPKERESDEIIQKDDSKTDSKESS